MEILTQIPFTLDTESLSTKYRIESGSGNALQFKDLLENAHQLANPKAVYKESFIYSKEQDSVSVDGVTFKSRALRANVDQVEKVFPYVVTCGRELDQIQVRSSDLFKRFLLDEIKAAILESCQAYLNDYLDSRYGLIKTASMHPGSGDVDVWPIQQQSELFTLLGDVYDAIGVELTESFLMIPTKSVSGIRFATQKDFESCMLCHREVCTERSAPFDQILWDTLNAV
ncbi:vitamin B12 dependent-methionine synthase activation domain-containing protein [Chloroflexota bacterium]